MSDFIWLLSFASGYLCSIGKEVVMRRDDIVFMQWNAVDVIRTEPYVIKAEDVPRFIECCLPG